MDSSGWSGYIDSITHLLQEAEWQYGHASMQYSQYITERLEFCMYTCRILRAQISSNSVGGNLDWCQQTLDQLLERIRIILGKWQEYLDILSTGPYNCQIRHLGYQVSVGHTGQRGRPRFDISREQLEHMSSMSFSWSEIAALLGVSRSTLFRRRSEFGLLQDPTRSITDQELEAIILELRTMTPAVGESMLTGNLRSWGYHVSRERVRRALRSTDPLNSALRWPGVSLHRRPYSVPGPNSLWHIDGHHKPVRWRLVTHAGIDGHSRLIVFLKCSGNNRASTVYELFLQAVGQFHLPSRVRSDQGRENIRVAQHMLERRGAERRSIITGSSVDNQRIERLWRDLHQGVTLLYYRLFYFLEGQGILDPLNNLHLYALHYVFLPRINRAQDEFRSAWNHHLIRTAHSRSPHQLFIAGLLLLQNSQLTALDFFEDVDSSYGVDDEGPVPDEEDGTVSIPTIDYHPTPAIFQRLCGSVDPLSQSDNYGIDLYEQSLQILT